MVRGEGIDKKVTKSDTEGERWGCSEKVMSLTQNIFVSIFLKFNFSFSGSQMVLIILQRETIKLHSKCYLCVKMTATITWKTQCLTFSVSFEIITWYAPVTIYTK